MRLFQPLFYWCLFYGNQMKLSLNVSNLDSGGEEHHHPAKILPKLLLYLL